MCEKCAAIEDLIRHRRNFLWEYPSESFKHYGEFALLNNIVKILHPPKTDKDILIERKVIKY